jgi:uncharacterized protein YbjT (DUF2867 family)
MNILITGISGYLGPRLALRLARDGHTLRGLARDASLVELDLPVARGDALTGAGLDRALHRIDVAYFLIHSMEPAANGTFATRERSAAENFARAAGRCGVQRIVYLGAPVAADGLASPHLASRLVVEQILLRASPCSIALRAPIVIGAGSRSFRLLVHLIERLPVLALPAWRSRRSAPIDERDIVELLARAATAEGLCGRALEAGGPEVISYEELIDCIRHHMLLPRPMVALGSLTATPIASRIVSVLAGEEHALVAPLMETLDLDLLPRGEQAAELLGVRLHSLDAAIERALREWEALEPLAAR